MICKLSKGKGFRGLFNYLHADAEGGMRGQVLGTNLAGTTPRAWAKEMAAFRRLRPKLGKAVFHASLSLAPEDRTLTDAEFAQLARAFLVGMGFEEAPFLVIRHHDTAHQHAHIVASRIDCRGRAISDSGDYAMAEKLARLLEVTFGLRQLTPHNYDKEADMETNTLTPAAEPGELAALNETAMAAPAGPLDEKTLRNYKRRLLEASYRQTISDRLAGELAFVSKSGRSLAISFKGGGKVYDDGDKLRAYGDDETASARRLVQLCLTKGWGVVRFTGSDAFVEAAMREALAMGLQVKPMDDKQARMLAGIVDEHTSQPAEQASPDSPAIPELSPDGLGRRLKHYRDRMDGTIPSANINKNKGLT